MSRVKSELLALQRSLTWEKEEWFVPLSAALEGVGPAEAAWQPPGGGNTIWQTVNHVNYYNERMMARMRQEQLGQGLPDNDATFGEPGNAQDAAAWQATLERTRHIAEGLRATMAELDDAALAQPVATTTVGDALASWVMHDAYHAGQIVLIRKQQGSWPAKRG